MIRYPHDAWELGYEDGRDDVEAGTRRDLSEPAIVERLYEVGAPQWEDYVAAYLDGYMAAQNAR